MRNLENKVRDLKFDIMKAIAIYLVVYGHLLDNLTSTQIYLITFCHMPVFFFVSGYFYNKSINKYSYKEILIKKIKGLLFPYLIWSGISYFANIILVFIRNGNSTGFSKIVINEFLEIFMFSRSVWYLIELFFVTIIFLLFVLISNKLHRNLLLIALIGWLVISLIIPSNMFAFYKFKWLFPFFLMGYYASNIKGKIVLNIPRIQTIYCLICGIIYLILGNAIYKESYFDMYIMFKYTNITSVLIGGIYYLISMFSIFFIFILAFKIQDTKIGGGMLSEIGNYTIDIYVLHMFLIKFVIWIPKEIPDSVLSFIWLPLYTFIIVLNIFILSKYIFRKFSVYRFSIGVK